MLRWLPLLAVFLASCAGTSPQTEEGEIPRELPGLHNVLRVTDKLLSGGSPEGEGGFESLQSLGVKTVISVDGARPDVERARRFGLRYVHLPIGYDGVPRHRALRIARAVAELPGLVYLHCHHGKHRGPAAAALVRLCLDEKCKSADAVAFLKQAGTAPRYSGLYASAESFTRPTNEEWNAVEQTFPETAEVTSLVRLMVEIDKCWEHLGQAKKAGWKSPANHPDLDPHHEAVQLWELYREAGRMPDVKEQAARFREWMNEGERSARELVDALGPMGVDRGKATKAYEASAKVCADCHAKYRDAPR